MRSTPRSLALYLLLSIPSLHFATASEAYPWPMGVDASVKLWPPGTGYPKRWLQEFAKLHPGECSGVKKMSAENPGEKFYWGWENEASNPQDFLGSGGSKNVEETDEEDVLGTYKAPLRIRSDTSNRGIVNVLLGKRQNFECAAGRYSCTAIGVPGSCCGLDEVCERIEDIGYGNVGCCPSGLVCGGNLTGCGSGKKACARNQGGGCCIDGEACSANGCVLEAGSASSVTATPTVASTCSSGYYACPSNVAGGCCPSGRLCGVSDCPAITGTATMGDTCPTGYYTCAPQYNGGCCRIGRDCGITDCPERAVTISNGSAGAGGLITMTTAAPSCATGWQTCASSVGGGCCPIGYICGMTDCPAITVGVSGYIVSGQTLTAPVVYPATNKAQPTAMVVIPNNGAFQQRGGDGVKKVIVVVAVVVGVVAAA